MRVTRNVINHPWKVLEQQPENQSIMAYFSDGCSILLKRTARNITDSFDFDFLSLIDGVRPQFAGVVENFQWEYSRLDNGLQISLMGSDPDHELGRS